MGGGGIRTCTIRLLIQIQVKLHSKQNSPIIRYKYEGGGGGFGVMSETENWEGRVDWMDIDAMQVFLQKGSVAEPDPVIFAAEG